MANHTLYYQWLFRRLTGPEPFGVSPLVLSGFLRTVTHPRIFKTPTPSDEALRFAEQVCDAAGSVLVLPGRNHKKIFLDLCRQTGVQGNGIPDAYHAALAIESGCEWVTEDGGFARFPGLRWSRPKFGT